MTIDEYKELLLIRVDAFFDSYKKEHENRPDDYPLDMDVDDWDDQVLAGVFDIY